MLKFLSDDEIEIQLIGKNFGIDYYKYIIPIVFLVGVSFMLNQYFNNWLLFLPIIFVTATTYFFVIKKKKVNRINTGKLLVYKNSFIHINQANIKKTIQFQDSIRINTLNDAILLELHSQDKVFVAISGFENHREAEVMSAFLQGEPINLRQKNIKMQSKP